MFRRMKSVFASAAIATVASATFFSIAYAEGSWNSSIYGALPGFTSRSWQDNNHDSASTVTYFQGCSLRYGSLTTIDVALYDKMGMFPDYRVTGVNRNCGSYNFGRMTRPNEYYFKIERVNNSNVSNYYLDVSYVQQSY